MPFKPTRVLSGHVLRSTSARCVILLFAFVLSHFFRARDSSLPIQKHDVKAVYASVISEDKSDEHVYHQKLSHSLKVAKLLGWDLLVSADVLSRLNCSHEIFASRVNHSFGVRVVLKNWKEQMKVCHVFTEKGDISCQEVIKQVPFGLPKFDLASVSSKLQLRHQPTLLLPDNLVTDPNFSDGQDSFSSHSICSPTFLDVSSKKGLTNAMSSWLSGVHLAGLLGWGIILPPIYTSKWGENNDVWGQYSTYHELAFEELFDRDHFITSVETQLGIPVLTERPEEYSNMKNECPEGRCRGSYDDLVRHFSKFKGRYVVEGPNIAAGIINSRTHQRGVRKLASFFRLSPPLSETARAAVDAMKHNGTLIYLHFRYEPDAMKIEYAGSPDIFLRNVLQSLNRVVAIRNIRAVVYFASGLNITTILKMPSVQNFLSSFGHATAVNREVVGIPKYTFMAQNAAIDYEIGIHSDMFFGTVQTSFTAFVMLGRRMLRHEPGTSYAFDVLDMDHDACSGITKSHAHWQMELSIPYNDCLLADPCKISEHWAAITSWMVSKSCTTYDLDLWDGEYCSGMAAKYFYCRKTSGHA